MVFTLPLFYRIFSRKFPLSIKELKVCWFSGMIRGVIAFALCLQIDSSHKKFIITIALVIVLFTSLAGSSLIKTYAKWIGIDDRQL